MADPGGLGARFVNPPVGRRTFLGQGLVLMLTSATRRLWAAVDPPSLRLVTPSFGEARLRSAAPHASYGEASAPHPTELQATAPPRYRPLAHPVVVSLADLSAPWRPRPFVADAMTLASAAKPNTPIRIAGMVVRTAAGDDQPDRFRAVCARCPHEHCDVDFMTDASRLPPEVVQEIGRAVKDPVYLCPCHNSTFAAADGERLAGPAPRGLYRFRVTSVTATAVEIAEVEEDLLIFA